MPWSPARHQDTGTEEYFTRFRFLILAFPVLVPASGAVAQTNSCQVPDHLKKEE
jgi:hypothetical protein